VGREGTGEGGARSSGREKGTGQVGKEGLMQRSRIITHMAGNAYFTLIKSVFFFARLSNLFPSPPIPHLHPGVPPGSPSPPLSFSLPLHHRAA